MGIYFSSFYCPEQTNCRSGRHKNVYHWWSGLTRHEYFPIEWEVFFKVPKNTPKKDIPLKLREWRTVIDQHYYCEKCREEISNSPYLRWARLNYISY